MEGRGKLHVPGPADAAGEGELSSDGASSSVDSLLRDVARSPERTSLLGRLTAGTLVAGRFRLVRSLGEGGMGVVWQAVHSVTRKAVALKFLKRWDGDRVAIQRFLREARAASAVRHPGVVEVHDVLELEDGSPVMVMELLKGETLAERLAREHVVPLAELARITIQVCAAVGKAHELGVVHRDLKPENIFLEKSDDPGAAPHVKVLDFGIAKLTALDGEAAKSGADTKTGTLVGTPFYMSPEQMFGERDVDHRADIWAIGIILYEALAGVRPTQGENIGQILKIVTTDAIVPLETRAPDVPGDVAMLVAQMLHRDRAKRPADLRVVCDALHAYTEESATPFGPPATFGTARGEEPTSTKRPSPVPVSAEERSANPGSVGPVRRGGRSRGVAALLLSLSVASGGIVWMLARPGVADLHPSDALQAGSVTNPSHAHASAWIETSPVTTSSVVPSSVAAAANPQPSFTSLVPSRAPVEPGPSAQSATRPHPAKASSPVPSGTFEVPAASSTASARGGLVVKPPF